MPNMISGDLIEGSNDPDYLEGGDGDDTIIGYAGNDTLVGGKGSDTFVFGDGFDHDVIMDFTPSEDFLEIRSSDVRTWDDFLDRLSADEDDNALLALDDGSTLLLLGVAPDQIKQSDVQIDGKPIPCFAAGTLIRTSRGPVAVERLRIGDPIVTLDNGVTPLRWIGQRTLSAQYLRHSPALWPVRIAAGALGGGRPSRDLIVSPQHRVILAGPMVQACIGEFEVLVAARDLVGQDGITRFMPEGITYVHLMFDTHHIIDSEGAWTESFQPSHAALNGLDRAARDEMLTLFPDLASVQGLRAFASARPVLAAHETGSLLAMQQRQSGASALPDRRAAA